jgi:uncharacterized damage-inducible protein DinB
MPYSRKDLIKERFASTRNDLMEIVERISPDMLEWAPAPGMRTISGQLAEIIAVEMPLVPQLKENRRMPYSEVDEIIGDLGDLGNLRRWLDEVRETTLRYLDELSEGELAEEVPCGDAWFGTLWLEKMPRAEHFLNITEHEFYHVGQLVAYLWARGDDPYKW